MRSGEAVRDEHALGQDERRPFHDDLLMRQRRVGDNEPISLAKSGAVGDDGPQSGPLGVELQPPGPDIPGNGPFLAVAYAPHRPFNGPLLGNGLAQVHRVEAQPEHHPGARHCPHQSTARRARRQSADKESRDYEYGQDTPAAGNGVRTK